MFGRIWKYLKETPTWTWLALFLISAIFTTHALRQNNYQMIRLREAVYAADKSGKNLDQALNNLRSFVYGHMNTALSSGGNTIKPPIQLQYTYDRLARLEQAKANQKIDQINATARNYCAKHQPGKYREDCFKAYVDAHDVKANAIPAALYQYDFLSPTWSPDSAGWGIVLTTILGIAVLISFSADRAAAIKHRHRH